MWRRSARCQVRMELKPVAWLAASKVGVICWRVDWMARAREAPVPLPAIPPLNYVTGLPGQPAGHTYCARVGRFEIEESQFGRVPGGG